MGQVLHRGATTTEAVRRVKGMRSGTGEHGRMVSPRCGRRYRSNCGATWGWKRRRGWPDSSASTRSALPTGNCGRYRRIKPWRATEGPAKEVHRPHSSPDR